MSGQIDLIDLVHVESLERALLDGVKLDREEGQVDGRMRVDLGLVPVFSDERPLLGLAGLIDWRGSGRLSALLRSGFCTAGAGEQLLLPCDRRLPVDRLVLVGLGARASFDLAQARAVADQLVKISTGLRAHSVLIALPTTGIDRALAEAMFEALLVAIEQLEEGDEGDEGEEGDEEDQGDEEDERAIVPSDTSLDPAEVPGSDAKPEPDAAPESPAPTSSSDVSTARWWVAVDPSVVARLRRVLSGPPRAAKRGTSLHT